MKYMLSVYANEKADAAGMSERDLKELVGKHRELARDLGKALVGGHGLKDVTTATTVRTRSGKQSVHDGPFAETKEQLGGFYIVDVPDLDAAIAIAKRVPHYKDGSIEIRPLLDGE